MWNPSYDFRLFDIGWVSPLQANEFGAASSFSASDPTSFVDYSLNQLYGLLNPRAAYPFVQRQLPVPIEDIPFATYFQGQSRAEIEAEVRRRQAEVERARRDAEEAHERIGVNIWDILRGRTVRSGEGTGPILGSGANQPGDASVGDDPTHSGQKISEWIKALPEGSGVFLIAVAALIFILLFVRR